MRPGRGWNARLLKQLLQAFGTAVPGKPDLIARRTGFTNHFTTDGIGLEVKNIEAFVNFFILCKQAAGEPQSRLRKLE